ncbi:hypothetical protein GCM10010270_09870 [Streptomyces violaceus]|nr:hypothetical protein GCM10010270_09870 [Streptomyces janthinus]
MIIAVAGDRTRIEEITADDPFVTAGVCAYRVTEFTATKTAPALEAYRERAPLRHPPHLPSARCSWLLFMLERPSTPLRLASWYSWS